MEPETFTDTIAPSGYGPQRSVAAIAVGLVAGLWGAAALGVPVLVLALLATVTFAVLAVLLVRELDGRRRRRTSVAATLKALKAREARFKILADSTADMIVESDRDAVRRFVSPSSVALLGYAPEELVGARAFDLVHPDDVEAYRGALATLLDGTQRRVTTTQRYRRKDGVYIWTEGNVQATRDPVSGEPTGYVGSLRDVTERHVAAAAVRESEAFLRGVIDASPDCIKVLDLDGQISFMSRNGLCLLDFDRQGDAVGRDFATLWPEPERPQVRSAVAAAAAGAGSRFAARCLSAKGRPLHLDVLVTPIMGVDGRPERLLAISRDVTFEAEAEAALRDSQDRYRLLAENSSDVVMLLAPGSAARALYASPSCLRVLGAPPEDVLDRGPLDLVHPEDRAAVAALLADLAPEDGIVVSTHRVRRPDDGMIWVEVAFQMAERAGEPVVVAALRDVTERQQRAEDLAAARDVAERAQRHAEQASEAKSDFLAAMSHEIRTPLNSIIGFTDLMADAGDLPPQAQRHAELIRASGAALLTVVNDILDFSKIEAGAVELESIAFSPEDLARHCADIVRGYAGTKALDIEVEIGARLPRCLFGDESRLRQVLLNLLNNAVKFTRAGRVTLRVTRVGGAEGTETVRFEVADTGIGIPADQQHRLFERFSQVDSSVARRFGGSGLGLAICKKLVDLMGGDIGVSSRAGAGSTFWFAVTLPLAVLSAPRLPAASAVERRLGRILVVEDIDINQRLVVALLEGAGHTVEVVGDGALAVAAVAARPYDLVLMDVQMPGMDGVTATRLIRGSGAAGHDVPIVAMTANVFPEQIQAFGDAGMNDHVGKPLIRAQLQAVVERWLGAGRPADPPAVATREPSREPEAGFDAAALEQLRTYLGEARLDDVLARLAASLPGRFASGAGGADDARRWKADAHVLLSVAGMTGFSALVRCCRLLEAEAAESPRFSGLVAEARSARDAALPMIVRLRRDLAPTRDVSDTAA